MHLILNFILFHCLIFEAQAKDVWDEIDDVSSAFKLDDCFEILGIDDSEFKRENFDLEKVYKQRQNALENSANAKNKVNKDKLQQLKTKLFNAKERLKNFLIIRDIIRQANENTLDSNWNILDIKNADRYGPTKIADGAQRRTEQIKKWKNGDKLPTGSEANKEIDNAVKIVESARKKLQKYWLLKEIGDEVLSSKTLDELIAFLAKMDANLKLRSSRMDENEINAKERLLSESIRKTEELPKNVDNVLNRAKKKLERAVRKLKNFVKFRDLMELKEEENVVDNLKIIGAEKLNPISMSSSDVESAIRVRLAQFQSRNEFPADASKKLNEAIEKINASGEKLKNFVRIRPLLEINMETTADLLKMLQLDNTQSDTFMERDLMEAKKKLDNAMKLPKDIEDGMRKKVENAFQKLSNYLQIRAQHLSRGDTIDENLSILGIETGKRNSYEKADILKGKESGLPDELPSDVDRQEIRKKIEKAATKMENFLTIRNIIAWTKENSLESNWKIVGLKESDANNVDDVQKSGDELKQKIQGWQSAQMLPTDAKVSKANSEIDNAKERLKNYLKLKTLANADMASLDVEGLVKLLDEKMEKLEPKTFDESKLKEAKSNVQRNILLRIDNLGTKMEDITRKAEES